MSDGSLDVLFVDLCYYDVNNVVFLSWVITKNTFESNGRKINVNSASVFLNTWDTNIIRFFIITRITRAEQLNDISILSMTSSLNSFSESLQNFLIRVKLVHIIGAEYKLWLKVFDNVEHGLSASDFKYCIVIINNDLQANTNELKLRLRLG